MQNILRTVLSLIIISVVLFSCENEEVSIQEEQSINIENLLLSKYDLSKIDNSSIDLTQINLTNKNYEKNNAVFYSFNYSNEQIAIFTNSINPNKYLVFRGNILKKGTSNLKEVEITFDIDSKKNGNIAFLNITSGNNFTLNFEEGKPIYSNSRNANPYDSNVAEKSLCQQQGGEGFEGCFERESYEFMDGFVSTVAYITNPSIALLIAAMCTC